MTSAAGRRDRQADRRAAASAPPAGAVAARVAAAPRAAAPSRAARARGRTTKRGRSTRQSMPRRGRTRQPSAERATSGGWARSRPRSRPCRRPGWHRVDARPRRCYHRASLRQFCRSSLRRARWGLFLRRSRAAPIGVVSPERRRFTRTPLPEPKTQPHERNHGTQLSTREDPQHRDHGAHRRR